MELEQLYIDLVTARYAGNYLTAVFNQILEYKIVNTELQFICTKLNIKQNFSETTVIEETNEDADINEETKSQKNTRKRSKRKSSKKRKNTKSKAAKRVEENENQEVKKEDNADIINDL